MQNISRDIDDRRLAALIAKWERAELSAEEELLLEEIAMEYVLTQSGESCRGVRASADEGRAHPNKRIIAPLPESVCGCHDAELRLIADLALAARAQQTAAVRWSESELSRLDARFNHAIHQAALAESISDVLAGATASKVRITKAFRRKWLRFGVAAAVAGLLFGGGLRLMQYDAAAPVGAHHGAPAQESGARLSINGGAPVQESGARLFINGDAPEKTNPLSGRTMMRPYLASASDEGRAQHDAPKQPSAGGREESRPYELASDERRAHHDAPLQSPDVMEEDEPSQPVWLPATASLPATRDDDSPLITAKAITSTANHLDDAFTSGEKSVAHVALLLEDLFGDGISLDE